MFSNTYKVSGGRLISDIIFDVLNFFVSGNECMNNKGLAQLINFSLVYYKWEGVVILCPSYGSETNLNVIRALTPVINNTLLCGMRKA